MRKFILLAVFALSFSSCSEDEENNTNCIDQTLLIDKNWKHKGQVFANIKFGSDKIYYENLKNDGNYTINCNTIRVVRPSNTFELNIVSINNDSLILNSSTWGDVTYYKIQ